MSRTYDTITGCTQPPLLPKDFSPLMTQVQNSTTEFKSQFRPRPLLLTYLCQFTSQIGLSGLPFDFHFKNYDQLTTAKTSDEQTQPFCLLCPTSLPPLTAACGFRLPVSRHFPPPLIQQFYKLISVLSVTGDILLHSEPRLVSTNKKNIRFLLSCPG